MKNTALDETTPHSKENHMRKIARTIALPATSLFAYLAAVKTVMTVEYVIDQRNQMDW